MRKKIIPEMTLNLRLFSKIEQKRHEVITVFLQQHTFIEISNEFISTEMKRSNLEGVEGKPLQFFPLRDVHIEESVKKKKKYKKEKKRKKKEIKKAV